MLKVPFAIVALLVMIGGAHADHWWGKSYGPSLSALEAKSRPPQRKSNDRTDEPATDQRDTELSAIPVKLLNTGKTAEETAQDAKYQNDQATTNRWMIWLTGVLGAGSLLLFVAGLIQIRISSDTAKKQLRAYVGLVKWKIELSPHQMHTAGNNAIEKSSAPIYENFVCATVKNFGPTPARDVVFVGGIISCNFGQRIPSEAFSSHNDMQAIIDAKAFVSHFTLFPSQEETTKMAILDPVAITAIKNVKKRKAAIFIWGRFYYRDIYSRPWRTKVCHTWEPWHPFGERFVPYEEHNGEDTKSLEDQAGK